MKQWFGKKTKRILNTQLTHTSVAVTRVVICNIASKDMTVGYKKPIND
jgi:hypothetical protein